MKRSTKNKGTYAEYGLDSRYESDSERANEASMLMEARLKYMRNISDDQIIKARLMQLKFKMKDFVSGTSVESAPAFAFFLEMYIDSLYKRQSVFAKDLRVSASVLSQIINHHREPSEEFISRLMIHSEQVYQEVCDFNPQIWLDVHFKQKLHSSLAQTKAWIPKIKEEVACSMIHLLKPKDKKNKK